MLRSKTRMKQQMVHNTEIPKYIIDPPPPHTLIPLHTYTPAFHFFGYGSHLGGSGACFLQYSYSDMFSSSLYLSISTAASCRETTRPFTITILACKASHARPRHSASLHRCLSPLPPRQAVSSSGKLASSLRERVRPGGAVSHHPANLSTVPCVATAGTSLAFKKE